MNLPQARFAARNVADKLSKVLTTRGTAKFYFETYILSRFSKVEPDVLLVSYPKCGRTWVRMVLKECALRLGEPEVSFPDKGLVQISGQLVKFEHGQGNWVPAPPRLEQLAFDRQKYAGRRVIFLVRDPRDVLVSSWYHLRYRENIYRQDLSAFVRDPLVGIEKIVAFMNLFLEHAEELGDFHLLSYEDLHARPQPSFKSLMRFLGVDVEDRLLDAAIEACSFERMRKMETRGSMREPWMRPGAKDLDKALKVRRGKVGSYRDELSDADVKYVDAVLRERLHPQLPYGAGVGS